jgi:hypothetical protein
MPGLSLCLGERLIVLRVRFNQVRFHAKARSREVKTSVNFR